MTKELTSKEKGCWVLTRNDYITNIFKNRKMAIKYFKELLTQSLKDFENQDRTNEFNYSIKIPRIEIKEIKHRESYLGL